MKVSISTLAAIAACASTATAHYNFEALIVDGKVTGPYEFVRPTTAHNSPVADVNSLDMRCNVGGGTAGATKTIDVAAGAKVGFTVKDSISHPGPLLVYLSKAPAAAAAYDGSGDWFKIFEQGLKDIGEHAVTWQTDSAKTVEFTIPKDTPDGEYLLRVEHIGLHGAMNEGGAQAYMSCAQIKIVGGGSGAPGPLTKFPGAYKSTDPGLLLNIYNPVPKSYAMPGPAVWSAARTRRHARDVAI